MTAPRSRCSSVASPKNRAYLVFAGLEQAIGDLLRPRFSAEQVEAIRRWPSFAGDRSVFFEALESFRFEGDVWSVPEGTVVFPGETLLRVEAPTCLRPSRSRRSCWRRSGYPDARGIEGLRGSSKPRQGTSGPSISVHVVGMDPRPGSWPPDLSYIAGFGGISHVEAARGLGIPASGYDGAFLGPGVRRPRPRRSNLRAGLPWRDDAAGRHLRHPRAGVRHAAAIEPADPGDPTSTAATRSSSLVPVLRRDPRRAGVATQVKIFSLSGDLEELEIARLVQDEAPIDAFGVGTELITSKDAPPSRSSINSSSLTASEGSS